MKRWLAKKGSKKVLAKAYHKYNTSEKGRLSHKRYRDRVRDECIEAYGGECACCGDGHKEFLSMDHIKGGGTKHRRILNGVNFWWWLKKHGFPRDDYRLLCMNCNFALGKFGYCPHERERAHGTEDSND